MKIIISGIIGFILGCINSILIYKKHRKEIYNENN